MGKPRLIVGLGNPGNEYRNTRHNIGFEVLDSFAKDRGWLFRHAANLEGDVAKGVVGEDSVLLLMPMTYMNLSGRSMRKTMDYYKVLLSDVLVVADDIYVPFGRFRLRREGGAGGHNGLKSIFESVGSQNYARLRVGIGQNLESNLSEYVLGKYRKEELEIIPAILKEAVHILNMFIELGIEKSLQYANCSQIGIDQGEKKNG
jgi:PTH1 family peptidyl-tRNA hydrolase